MDRKAEETTHNINDTFDPGTANECTVQWWFKKFCKGDESLEDGELNDKPLEVGNDQLRAVIKADPLITTHHWAFEANWKGEKVRQVGASWVKVSRVWLFATPWTVAHQPSLSWDFLGKNTEEYCHSLLQMIFPIQGLNQGLLHCGQILYCLSCQGSPGASWADHKSKNLHFEV